MDNQKTLKEVNTLAKAFQKATKITFSLVFLPIILLLTALFLDRKYCTTPFFIITAIILGITAGIFKAINLKKGRVKKR